MAVRLCQLFVRGHEAAGTWKFPLHDRKGPTIIIPKWSWFVVFLIPSGLVPVLTSPPPCARSVLAHYSLTAFYFDTLRPGPLSEAAAGATRVLCIILKLVPTGWLARWQKRILRTDWLRAGLIHFKGSIIQRPLVRKERRTPGRPLNVRGTAFRLDTHRVIPRPSTTRWGGARDLSVPACPTVSHC
jgi:hypothetical protein